MHIHMHLFPPTCHQTSRSQDNFDFETSWLVSDCICVCACYLAESTADSSQRPQVFAHSCSAHRGWFRSRVLGSSSCRISSVLTRPHSIALMQYPAFLPAPQDVTAPPDTFRIFAAASGSSAHAPRIRLVAPAGCSIWTRFVLLACLAFELDESCADVN